MPPLHRTYELLIILAALAAMALAALRAIQGRKATDASGYFLAGRDVGWLPLGISLFVTSMWAVWIWGLAKPVAQGVAGWLLPGGVVIAALVVLGVGFAASYRESDAITLPAFLGERFGRHVGFAVALATIALTLLVHIPFTLLIGTEMVNALMGWDFMSSGLLMVVIPGLFVVAGGYSSAIAIQSAGGIVAALGLLFLAVDGVPMESVFHRALPDTPAGWPSLAAGLIVLALWSYCMEQQVVQRVFAARSSRQARRGSLTAAGLIVPGVVAVLAGSEGMGAAGLRVNTSGVAIGFIVSGIIAFCMASLSAHFLSVSTLVTMDLFRPAKKAAGEAALVLVGRLTSTAVVILSILTASSMALIRPALLDWMMPLVLAVAPPIVAVVILGLLVPRMHGRGAFSALLAGWIAGLLQMGLGPDGSAEMIGSSIVTFAVTAIVFVFVSLTVAPLGTLRKVPETIVQMRKP